MVQAGRDFGEVLIMDTANKRNKYNMPLFFCCCIDGDGKTRLCAAALLFDEGADTWSWVLKNLKVMFDSFVKVQSIFTDSDLAIISTIDEFFPEVGHLCCAFFCTEFMRDIL